MTDRAIKLAEAQRLPDALVLFEKAVKVAPKNGQMWENLGVTQMRMLKLDEAAASFKTARKFSKQLGNSNLEALEDTRAKVAAGLTDGPKDDDDDDEDDDEEDDDEEVRTSSLTLFFRQSTLKS